MNCPSCQAPAPEGRKFCGECGAALTPAAEAPTTAQPSTTQPGALGITQPGALGDARTRVSRRQMTVLFCDLVGSTALAARLDPEDLLDALHRYHAMVRGIAARFGGFVARVVGDGVDLYFGYPMAGEDDAVRAVHAGLAIVEEIRHLQGAGAEPLQVRVGIATGMVAVSMQDAVSLAGSTPNLAARIQAAADPGTVAVAPGTRRIAGTQFDYRDLGSFELKGFDEPVHIHAVERATTLGSRSALRGRDAAERMVGRETELAALKRRWEEVVRGGTRGVLLSAEAGLGKSRLATAFDHALPALGHTAIRLQCSPFQTNSALQPFVAHLVLAAGFGPHDSSLIQLEKLEAQLAVAGVEETLDISLLAALLSIPSAGRYPPLAMPPPQQLHLTKEALKHYFAGLAGFRASVSMSESLTRYFVGLAEHRPLLLLCEDMHWIDPTSLELLDLILASADAAPILVLMTARPEFAPRWSEGSKVEVVPLARLDEAAVRTLALHLSREMALPEAALDTIIRKTDGVPLYVEEMTRMVLDIRASGTTRGDRAGLVVPDTLMDLLMERLDRLGPAKWLAQVASVIGREFGRDLLFAAAELAPADFEAALAGTLGSGLILPSGHSGEQFLFKHALVEDTAYGSIPQKRCIALHGRVAEVLLRDFAARVEHQPELAARHLTRAQRLLEAGGYWLLAGRQALGRGAPREAAAHLKAGLAALDGVADSPQRAQAELALLSMLGPTLMVLMGPGAAPFGETQKRAYALCHALPGAPRQFPVTYGLCLYHWGRAELETARALADELLAAPATQAGEPEPVMAAYNMNGMVQFHLGAPVVARAHLERSVAHYEPERDAALYPVYLMDFGVFGRFYLALATFVSGDAEQALAHARDAYALAGRLNQPHTLGFSMLANFVIAVLNDDPPTARQFAGQCVEFSSQFGFPEFIAMARVARGWATARDGQLDAGLADLQAGIDGWHATGFENWQSWFGVLKAEILIRLGRHGEALAEVERQLVRTDRNGEHQFRSLLLAEKTAATMAVDGDEAEAMRGFDEAETLARGQGAAAWVARIAARRAGSLHMG